MNESKEKFLKKNRQNINDLKSLILAGNIKCLLISSEMSAFFIDYVDEFRGTDIGENMIRLEIVGEVDIRPIMVIVNPYLPAGYVKIIRKDTEGVEFNIPCVCGFYSDEEHKHR